jgi:hypothetical protein
MEAMANNDGADDFFVRMRLRVDQVLDHVQRDNEACAKGAVEQMHSLVADAEAQGLRDVAEQARDGLAEAWRWRLGRCQIEAMDARVRLARIARELWRRARA